MQELLHLLEKILSEMVADPGKRISELKMMTEEERRQLVEGWNETKVEYEGGKRVHELFEEQAERTPQAVAVVYEEEEVKL